MKSVMILLIGKPKTICERVIALDRFYLDALASEDRGDSVRKVRYRWAKYRKLRDSRIPRRLV